MILKKYQNYLYMLFLKRFILVSLIFLCLVIIVNFFEEVRFSEKYNTEFFYIAYLSILNAPSLIFEIFPFIFLITIKIFYLNLSDKNELKILNSNGVSNFKIIYLLILLSTFIGIFLVLGPSLKIVKEDGLWIKEEIDDSVYFIHAEKFDKNYLKFITITEIDKYYESRNTIIAKKGDIISKNWNLSDVSVIDSNGSKNDYKSYVYNSSFNAEIISNLFSNLNALNIYELHELSNNYRKIGYSNTDIKIHLNKIYSMPLFYILMTILGFIIINKLKNFKSRFFVIIFGVLVSVVVYYLNYFSGVLGNKGILPIYLSVWTPILILFLLCNIGLLKVNEN